MQTVKVKVIKNGMIGEIVTEPPLLDNCNYNVTFYNDWENRNKTLCKYYKGLELKQIK